MDDVGQTNMLTTIKWLETVIGDINSDVKQMDVTTLQFMSWYRDHHTRILARTEALQRTMSNIRVAQMDCNRTGYGTAVPTLQYSSREVGMTHSPAEKTTNVMSPVNGTRSIFACSEVIEEEEDKNSTSFEEEEEEEEEEEDFVDTETNGYFLDKKRQLASQ